MNSLLLKYPFAGIVVLLTLLSFWGCDDMLDKPKPNGITGNGEATSIYILCEGLFNSNNSTLADYSLKTGTFIPDFFRTKNKRGLGDTANDMGIYGSKMYVVVNVSGCVEVLDANTGLSIKQIKITDDRNVSREPRYIAFEGGNAFVCNFDGTVCRIDTATLQINATVNCGKNPDGICVANGKLYVSNSGGLNFPNYDNTVSVIDATSFSEIKKITVGINPGQIHNDNEGDVYVVSRGNYGANPNKLQKINSLTDELSVSFENFNALNFTIHNDTAFIYNYDYTSQQCSIMVFDCKQDTIISTNFITDNTQLSTPYGIDVNPTNGDVYITDAKSYTIYGDVFCFDKTGKLKFQLKQVGLNPKKVLFR